MLPPLKKYGADMKKTFSLSENEYIEILKGELIPAMGCTEPIAVALAGALARETLGEEITKVEVAVSNNILKNVKSVVVPNAGGRKGVECAAAVGIVAGNAHKGLEVVSEVKDEDQPRIESFLNNTAISVLPAENDNIFDIVVRVFSQMHSATVHIAGYHTNVVEIRHDDEIVEKKESAEDTQPESAAELLKVEEIINFIETVELSKIEGIISKQIDYNSSISDEGLRGNYGANVGKTLLTAYGNDIKIRARAAAAAGSDARMSGCEKPVIVVSGSGNQGITTCLPVYEYAKELKLSREQTIRAVALSDLLTIHLKTGIGRLSAYCGAVSAGCAAGAAICYINGGGLRGVAHTLVNSLAIVSGIVCDGAKPSCAGKIAAAVEAGILGWQMYENGQQFYGGDGIVTKGVENTIENVGRLGREGMRQTDDEIVKIMLGR